MSISKKSIIGKAESKGKYLDTNALGQFGQTIREAQQRLKIVDLINKNSKQIIDQAINDYVQINLSVKQLDNDQTSILIQKIDIIFRFVTYAFLTKDDDILNSPELQKTYLELKNFVDHTAEIINSIEFLTVDYINNFLVKNNVQGDTNQYYRVVVELKDCFDSFVVKNNVESDTNQYSRVVVELEDYFDKVILTLEEVGHNSENQPNEENQKESAPVANVINIPEKHELNIWQRGNRMIVFASGCSFLGGIFGQLPGALIGAIAGAIYGSILKLETDSPN
jgi:hypothetical protein